MEQSVGVRVSPSAPDFFLLTRIPNKNSLILEKISIKALFVAKSLKKFSQISLNKKSSFLIMKEAF